MSRILFVCTGNICRSPIACCEQPAKAVNNIADSNTLNVRFKNIVAC